MDNASNRSSAPETDRQKKLAAIVALVVLALVAVGAVTVFPSASNQGFAPVQPIPFSHHLHAGVNKIPCQYCHAAAERSRHATIPAVAVCMNCHRVVKTDSPWIQKVQAAYKNNTPIEWIRVHELPDYVYFPHKRHIAAGLQCETCHGDVKNMERIHQEGALTMGWCMECHRGQTTPKQILAKFYPNLEPGDTSPHPVAPTNCSTCHN